MRARVVNVHDPIDCVRVILCEREYELLLGDIELEIGLRVRCRFYFNIKYIAPIVDALNIVRPFWVCFRLSYDELGIMSILLHPFALM